MPEVLLPVELKSRLHQLPFGCLSVMYLADSAVLNHVINMGKQLQGLHSVGSVLRRLLAAGFEFLGYTPPFHIH